jgi:adenylate cyclase
MQLDPFYPDLYLHFLAQSYYSLGRYVDAVENLEERLVRNPGSDISRVLLAASYGQIEEAAKAHAAWRDVFTVNESYSIDERRRLLPYADPTEFEHVLDGLRRTGVIA